MLVYMYTCKFTHIHTLTITTCILWRQLNLIPAVSGHSFVWNASGLPAELEQGSNSVLLLKYRKWTIDANIKVYHAKKRTYDYNMGTEQNLEQASTHFIVSIMRMFIYRGTPSHFLYVSSIYVHTQCSHWGVPYRHTPQYKDPQNRADFLMILVIEKNQKETGEMAHIADAKDLNSVPNSHIK